MDKVKETEEFGELIFQHIMKSNEIQIKTIRRDAGEKIAKKLYDTGYRNITEFKAWLEKTKEKKIITTSDYEEGYYNGIREIVEEVLDKLGG